MTSRELAALYLDLRDIIAIGADWLPECQRISEALDTGSANAVSQAVSAALASTTLRIPLLRQYLFEWGKAFNEYLRRHNAELGRAA